MVATPANLKIRFGPVLSKIRNSALSALLIMNQQSFLISIFSFIVLVAIAVLFLYLHLKSLQDEIVSYWESVLEKMRIRNDMIPNLIETVRKFAKNEDKLLDGLIQLRAKSWPMEEANGPKASAELSLTNDLHEVWQLPQKIPALNVDTNFLSLKKDFHELGQEIDEMVNVYNQKIRAFNARTGFVLLRPFFALMRMKRFQIFEFEP